MTTPPPPADDEPTPISFEKALPEEPDEQGEDDEENGKKKEQPIRDEAADSGFDVAADAGIEAVGKGAQKGRGSCDGCDGGCDVPGCDCNLLLRLSTLIAIAAVLVPPRSGALVRALLRGYRRWFTRFTPRCPSTPSCSAFALAAVESMGPRRGLAAAARRVRDCT